jgi:hypothetical protein
LLSLAALGALGACGASSSGTSQPATTEATVKARPAGVNPSKSARMVCASEANRDIADALEVKPATISPPTWVDHVYTCRYDYPEGAVTLAVKELSTAAETRAYFRGLAAQLGKQPKQVLLGDDAFVTTDGSVVVRKDFKVLTVDVSRLPATFGTQDLTASQTGEAIAATVMGCWTGS